ncbi:helix-turn-helix domain-containing protein [uncultured Oscillibacter sp.]|jgi:transcriptional regulator with XRE-family HTH domain|uniref:helix-turn-helix domain-containing protein n=1 Tax=uncultured Oscillibacter sp. TaxID=876091 RepID=UPI0025F13C25|nr:helix-turn-helix domain-containing protein [uncultured Oscillibacter sp.]
MKIYDYNGKKNISGNRIREVRLRRRLTQEELAAKMQLEGVLLERDSVSRIEIGTRFVSDYELLVFAEVLGVPANWLLRGEEALDAGAET